MPETYAWSWCWCCCNASKSEVLMILLIGPILGCWISTAYLQVYSWLVNSIWLVNVILWLMVAYLHRNFPPSKRRRPCFQSWTGWWCRQQRSRRLLHQSWICLTERCNEKFWFKRRIDMTYETTARFFISHASQAMAKKHGGPNYLRTAQTTLVLASRTKENTPHTLE